MKQSNVDISRLSKEVQDDIIELREKIDLFKKGIIPEERFKAFRLTRGVYGQRQLGVQMFRTKLPFGRITPKQLSRIADISDTFTNGNLHLTTRQNIQLHYIPVEDSPAIWELLEDANVTAREACGNTVRNITASSIAGIDPEEPFDVSPYAYALFEHFLRNPICQDMGRKIKMAFSSSKKDSGLIFMHDIGFLPKIKNEVRGFEIRLGGGLGGQPFQAQTAFDFLPADEVIPFVEAVLRVFDRYGEREKRFKARMKFLIDDKKGIGITEFMRLVEEEKKGLPYQKFPIKENFGTPTNISDKDFSAEKIQIDEQEFADWKKTNVFQQKQKDFFAVIVKVPLGNIFSEKARGIAKLAEELASDDMRITVHQNLLLKYVREKNLPYLFAQLKSLELDQSGAEKTFDIIACPGTDTCNLGVSSSTDVSLEIEKMLRKDFPDLLEEENINIKISGCMNACGQHTIANIGFHGSSIKVGTKILPALQVLLGGGFDENNNALFAEKVIKIPSKRVLDVIALLLNDFRENAEGEENFNQYFQRQGKIYFYNLLKPFADVENIKADEFVDWGDDKDFIPAIGIGECASVSYDLVSTIVNDAKEKYAFALKSMDNKAFADAIYHIYTLFIIGAKALLLKEDKVCNTHIGILNDFEAFFVQPKKIEFETEKFADFILEIKKQTPSEDFAKSYLESAKRFLSRVEKLTQSNAEAEQQGDDLVISNYYKA